MNRSLAKNSAANLSGYMAVLVLTFFMTPILVNGLGEGAYGIWSLVNSILVYLALGEMGIGAAVVRYTAKFDGAGDTQRGNEVLSASIVIFCIVGLFVFTATLVLVAFLPSLIKIPDALVADARWLLLAAGSTIAIGLPLGVYSSLLAGLRRYGVKNLISTSNISFRYGLYFVVVHEGWGLKGIAAATIVSGLFGHACRITLMRRIAPQLRFSFHHVSRSSIRLVFAYSTKIFLAQIAQRLGPQTTVIFIGMFLGPAFVTHFAIAGMLVSRATEAIRAILNPLTPEFSRLEGKRDTEGIGRLLTVSISFAAYFVLPFAIALVFFGHDFLSLWLNPKIAAASYPLMVVLALALPVTPFSWVGNRLLQGTGNARAYAILSITQGVALVSLNLFLINYLGLMGAAVGTAAVHALFAVGFGVAACRQVAVSLASLTIHAFPKPIVASLGAGIAWAAVKYYLPVDGWMSFLCVLLSGSAVYLGLVLTLERWLRAQLMRRMRSSFALACS